MPYRNVARFNNLLGTITVTLLILFGSPAPGKTADTPPLNITPPPPALEEMKNATYTGIDTVPIKLTNGHYESAPFLPGSSLRLRVDLLQGQPAIGDLNGDGIKDSVVFLSEDDGGSGVFLYMAVMTRSNGRLVNISSVRLGERLSVRSVLVEKGQISLELLQFDAKDAPCCPTEIVARVWTLEHSGLVERGAKKRLGTLKLASLEGGDWLFRGFSPQMTQPVDTSASLHLENSRISGSTGCNSYRGPITATKVPGEVIISATKTTNNVCSSKIMKDEDEYLTALRRSVNFSYYLGDLTLSWKKKDGSMGSMRFAPRPATKNKTL